MRTVILLTAALLLVSLTSLSAQQAPPVEVGSRVRVTAPDHAINRQVATFEALVDSMLVVFADSSINIPLVAVDRLEVSRREGHPWRGAGIGFLIGGGLGFAVSQTHACCVMDNPHSYGVAACSVLGGLLGAGFGFVLSTERWEEVPLDRLRVSIAPRRDGFAFGVSVSF